MVFLIMKTFFNYLYGLLIYVFSNKHKIYIFGDSHAEVFNYINKYLSKNDFFEVLAIGGATAQGLANPRSKTSALKLFKEKINLDCKKNDNLFFFLGEVDCGFVIWYRSKNYNESIDVQFERSLKNYQDFLISIKEEGYKNINIIETVLPTIFDGFEGQILHERKEVNVSIKKRTELTNRYNKRLSDIARVNNFGFIKITKDIMNETTGLINTFFLNKDKTNHHLSNDKFAPIIYKNILNVLEKKK
jgi:hypothetical protein